jgi:plasmid maintenance system antidote protein VapI
VTTQTEPRQSIPDAENPRDALRRLLADDDRNFAWLAKKTGLSLGHLTRVARGERPISADLAQKLAEIFDVPVTTFLPEAE